MQLDCKLNRWMSKMKKFIKIFAAVAVLSGLMLLSGCGQKDAGSAAQKGEKPVIAVSIVPEETFVEAVAGELCEVVVMVPPGSNPTNYEPTPLEMMSFSSADIYFSIGVPTETINLLPSMSKETKLISLDEACAKVYPELSIGEGRDPHIWLSPKRVMVMIDTIVSGLSELDPDNADTYKSNGDSFKTKLQEADAEVKAALEGGANRKFVVFHPAFGYLADDYGLTMFALEEEGKEATADHLAKMIDLAKAENIKVIFYQAEIDSRQSEAYAEEIGGKTAMLSPLSGDYIENLKLMAATMAEAMK